MWYKDQDGDGKVTTMDDRVVIGNPLSGFKLFFTFGFAMERFFRYLHYFKENKVLMLIVVELFLSRLLGDIRLVLGGGIGGHPKTRMHQCLDCGLINLSHKPLIFFVQKCILSSDEKVCHSHIMFLSI